MNYFGGSQKWSPIGIICVSSNVIQTESEILSRGPQTILTSNPVNNYPNNYPHKKVCAFLAFGELVFCIKTPDSKWSLNK